jgi:hypothetical protein
MKMAVVTLACTVCRREFEVAEEEGRGNAPAPLEDPYLAVPEHEDSAGLRCGGSLVPGEYRGSAV